MNPELNGAQDAIIAPTPARCASFPDEYRRRHLLAGPSHA